MLAKSDSLSTEHEYEHEHELELEDGIAWCPFGGCDWWAPEELAHLYEPHRKDTHESTITNLLSLK